MFINDEDDIERTQLGEYKAWMSGDSSEILNFFTQNAVTGIPFNPIYMRNKAQYFWNVSATEKSTKRVHSGLPRAMVDTLANLLGTPMFISSDPNLQMDTDDIVDRARVKQMVSQRYLPLTLGLGRGCLKASKRSDGTPFLSYYEADMCRMHWRGEELVRAEFFDWYRKDGKDYLLVDTRYVDGYGSHSDVDLYLMKSDMSKGERVPMDTLEETEGLEDTVIVGCHEISAFPAMFFDDPLHPHKGRSILAGKGDLFDMLDEIISVHNLTIRYSVPIEYFPETLMDRDPFGHVMEPNTYIRRYVKTAASGVSNDIGQDGDKVQVTQPDVKTDEYLKSAQEIIARCCTGYLSPTTMGVIPDKQDNAPTREKERTTVFTRNTINDAACQQLGDAMSFLLGMRIGFDRPHEVKIRFSDFANPSLESKIATLGGAWSNGQISTDLYVKTLWQDKLTPEEMEREKAALETYRDKALFAPLAYEGDNTNGIKKIDVPDTISAPGQGQDGEDKGEAGKQLP